MEPSYAPNGLVVLAYLVAFAAAFVLVRLALHHVRIHPDGDEEYMRRHRQSLDDLERAEQVQPVDAPWFP